jgi:hypothetical protein
MGFMDAEREAQRGSVTCPRSHSWQNAKWDARSELLLFPLFTATHPFPGSLHCILRSYCPQPVSLKPNQPPPSVHEAMGWRVTVQGASSWKQRGKDKILQQVDPTFKHAHLCSQDPSEPGSKDVLAFTEK